MRDKSGGLYPTFAVWENVPGAFSSNSGEDFRTVLEELARIRETGVSVPRPDKGKWAKAGYISGNGWSLEWRTFDAQFWGVPQRRRRIAVVVDFGGSRAGEILFERAGLYRDFEPSIPPWKGIARNPADGPAGYDRMVENEGECLTPRDVQSRRIYQETGKWPAIYAGEGGGHGYVMREEPVTYPGVGITSKQNASNPKTGDPCHTLNTDNRNYVCVPTVLCRAHGQANAETLEDCSPTLNCNHEQPVVFESHSQDARYTQQLQTSPACTAQWGTGGNNMPLVAEKCLTPWDSQARRVYSEDGSFPALAARGCAGQNQQTVVQKRTRRWVVRRLTPTECERLQGFPDGWTDIGDWTDSKGKRHRSADSPRYRALGNSIALPQWWWITCKMARFLPEHATLGSLFDGIGVFPLVWETRHGKGTAIWASEIEEFCVAVTKKRFCEMRFNDD